MFAFRGQQQLGQRLLESRCGPPERCDERRAVETLGRSAVAEHADKRPAGVTHWHRHGREAGFRLAVDLGPAPVADMGELLE